MPKYELSIEVDLPEGFGDFQALESKILEASREAGRSLLGRVLVDYEGYQIEKRPVQKRDQREKVFETLLGKVVLKRWRVRDVFKKKCIYPVDDWMGLKPYQKVSAGLVKEVVNQCVELSYSKATKVVNQMVGIKRSAMGNWKLIQSESVRRQKVVPPVTDWRTKSLPRLMPESSDLCPILSMDPDATYVRSRRKTEKKHELKIAVMYTNRHEMGKKRKKKAGSPRWALGQKQVVSVINETADKLFNRVTEKAVKDYGLHTGSRVIVHGDGDPWIKQYKNSYCPQALNRLDPYHVFKKIREATDLEEIPKDWIQDFYTHPGSLIKKVEALRKQMAEAKDYERLEQLVTYLKNNREGMEPSGVSKEIKKKYPRMYRRGSGTIESNVFQSICQRFKAPRMMWSEEGLKNLSFLREDYLNRSFDFKKVTVRQENYRQIDYLDELRDIVKDL